MERRFSNGASLTPPGEAWGVCQAIIVFTPGEYAAGRTPGIRRLRDMPAN